LAYPIGLSKSEHQNRLKEHPQSIYYQSPISLSRFSWEIRGIISKKQACFGTETEVVSWVLIVGSGWRVDGIFAGIFLVGGEER